MLVVEVPQGQTYSVRYSCYMSTENAHKMGAEAWVEKFAPANLSVFQSNLDAGRHWMLMPYRNLVLVHAVRQPLAIPKLTVLSATKDKGTGSAVGETSAILSGTLKLDASSTGKIQLQATWKDPFDDPQKPGFDESKDVVTFTADVGEVQIVSATNDTPPFKLTQFIKDTKFHRILYAPVGTTRFREYFDPKALPETLVRPTAEEIEEDSKKPLAASKPTQEAKLEIDIPNSARPAPPEIHSLVPTFRWDEVVTPGGATTTVTRTRVGGALRVYLERPWFSTGWGEQVGVVFAQPGQAASLPVEERQVLITHLAADPIYDSDQLPASEFTSPEDFKPSGDGGINGEVTLAENGMEVSVAGFEVRFDPARALWYGDLEFVEPTAYFPFVRLALVRFQPISVPGAHISPVVRAEYAQLLPSRTAVYSFSHDGGGKVTVDLLVKGVGFSPSAGKSSTEWAGVIERRAGPTSTDFEWEVVEFMRRIDAGGDGLFRATTELVGFQTDQFRVGVREFEVFPSDRLDLEQRLVYADARAIE